MAMTIKQIQELNLPVVEGVKLYANEHYSKGWDIIVEGWTDEDIAYEIGKTTNLQSAIAKIYQTVKLRKELSDYIEEVSHGL